MEYRRENTVHDLPKTGKNFGCLWRMLWEEVEDEWGLAVFSSSMQPRVTEISPPLRDCLKLAGGDSTVGEKLACMSVLHRPKRSWLVLINMLAGGFASERRESKPCKDGGVWPFVNAGVYNGEQNVTGCLLQTLMVCSSQCHVMMLCTETSYSSSLI